MRRLPLIGCLSIICWLFCACDWSFGPVENTPVLHQVSLVDTSPGQLNVKMTLNEDQSAADGKVAVSVQLSASGIRNPNDVQLTNKETMVCNGVSLIYDATSYAYIGNILSTSANYTCLYTTGGKSATLAVPIQTRLSPTFTVNGPTLTVTYDANEQGSCKVQVQASDNLHTVDGPQHPDDGVYVPLDVKDFNGSGKLRLTRICSTALPSPFHAVIVDYQASRQTDTTWKPAGST